MKVINNFTKEDNRQENNKQEIVEQETVEQETVEQETVEQETVAQEKSKLSTPRKIIIIILSLVIAFCIFKIVSIVVTYSSGDKNAEEISDFNGKAVDTDVVDGEGNDVVLPLKEINYTKLKSINKDFIAWIQGPDTIIDYPIVQSYDNDYYLHVQFDSSEHEYGALFLDYQNKSDFSDDVSIIYGHHMKNGSMFASIVNYRKQEYYNEHKYLILYTEEQNYLLEPYASTTIDGNNTIPLNYDDENKYQSYIDGMVARSDFKSDITMTKDSNTVILFTCTYEYDSARYILLCRLTPIN